MTRPERDTQHRERLLRATAEIAIEGHATLARIVQRAGVGRSTFYEFFDSPEHAIAHLEQRRMQGLERALGAAFAQPHAPLVRLRAIVKAWLIELESHPLEARVALLRRAPREPLSAAGKLLHATFERAVRGARSADASVLAPSDELALLAASAGVEAVTQRHLSGPPLREPARHLSELVVKLLA